MAVFYGASSLDGFIADNDDSVAFLDTMPPPEPSTYEGFIAGVGAIAMGRATYEFILRHMDASGDPWPYEQPCWVFTHQDFPARDGVTFAAGDVADAYPALQAAANGKEVWVCGGGDLVGQFCDAGLMERMIVQVASCTLGAGKPLLPRAVDLVLEEVVPMGGGFVELRYRIG